LYLQVIRVVVVVIGVADERVVPRRTDRRRVIIKYKKVGCEGREEKRAEGKGKGKERRG
jgi:hypothetical protein